MTHQLNPASPDFWDLRVDALGLRLEDSPVWAQIQRLHDELSARGIQFRPAYFVANEWGCPDGHPIVGIPFYLIDPRFHEIEDAHADDLEDGERILMGLRHEAGHALNYAYRLYDDPEWTAIFGAFSDEYDDDYLPCPFSRRYVRHLPGWYAQKHPDEDFAETFAVWMTPGLDWRARYAGTEALAKLEWTDRTMAKIGARPPVVDPATALTDPHELAFTVREFYTHRTYEDAPPLEELGAALDHDLRELFPAEGIGTDAATLIHDRRRAIMRAVSAYTGARMFVVKALISFLVSRLRELGLRAPAGKEADSLVGVTALVSTLTGNFLRTGHFAGVEGAEATL